MANAVISVDFRLALRNILRQRRRSLTAIAAIGFGVVAMMLASGYIEWIFWQNRELATNRQFGHIQLVKPGYYEEGKADPFAFVIPSSPASIDLLRKQQGVVQVSPRLSFSGLISHGESTLSFLGEGIDPEHDPLAHNLIITEGKRLDSKVPNGILIGTGLAQNLGVKSGDTVVLLTNTQNGGINAIEAKIQGLASTSIKSLDDSMLRVGTKVAQSLLRVTGSHVWVVTLKDTSLTDGVIDKIKHAHEFDKLEIVPWTKLADFYNKTVALFSRQIGVVKIIIAIIIVLSISNTMTMSVMERTVEIGTAMALGVRRQRILRLFLLEGALLGAFGGAVGIGLGYVMASAISAVGIPVPAAPGFSGDFTGVIMLTPSILFQAALLAVSTTLIASIYPAWRASRLVIVDALRHNR